jgi:hypothetical protein
MNTNGFGWLTDCYPQIAQISQIGLTRFLNLRNLRNLWIARLNRLGRSLALQQVAPSRMNSECYA